MFLDRPPLRRSRTAILLAIVVVAFAGCSAAATSSPSPSASPAGSRPSSPAVVTIVSPTAHSTVTGPTVHVVLSLVNATIVPATTTQITPDTGHVHLYVDNNLVSMNYGLTQDITLQPGTWDLRAEFVAADHAPFDPRVESADVLFTVK
jgi:hypothetical protein